MKLESLNDDYIVLLLNNIPKRIEDKDKAVDEIIKAKLKFKGVDRIINKAADEQDINKYCLGFRRLHMVETLIHEFMALYVYIADDYQILPFGAIQHAIEGGYTRSNTLGDFIEPESLIDVKSSPYATKLETLIKLSFELRMPVQIAVPHYLKRERDKYLYSIFIYKPK